MQAWINSVKTSQMRMTRKGKTKPRPHASVLLTRLNIMSWHLLESCGEWDLSDALVKAEDQWDIQSSSQQQQQQSSNI